MMRYVRMRRVLMGFCPVVCFLAVFVLSSLFLYQNGCAPVLTSVLVEAGLCGFLLPYVRTKRERISLTEPRRVSILIAFLFLPVFWLFVQALALRMQPFFPEDLSGYQEMSRQETYLYLLLSVLVAPLFEELLMRGVFYADLKRHVGLQPFVSAVVSSILFAAVHGTVTHLFVGFFCGMLFAFVREVSGSVFWAVLSHMTFNLFSAVGYGLVAPLGQMPAGGFAAVMALICILFLAWMWEFLVPYAEQERLRG